MSKSLRSAEKIPVVEAGRLKLRGHSLDDLSDCAAMWADPEVTRYIGGRPFTEEEVWTKLLRYVGHWSLMGFGYWAIEERATGRYVGELGFANFKRDIAPPIGDAPELGWALASHAHGKGYATEAVLAAVSWGDAHFGARRTICLVHPENLRSIRVAEKCGYRECRRTTYKGEPTILLSR